MFGYRRPRGRGGDRRSRRRRCCRRGLGELASDLQDILLHIVILLLLFFELTCFTSMEYPKSETAELVWNLFRNNLESTILSKEKINKRDYPREKSSNQCFPWILADFAIFSRIYRNFREKFLKIYQKVNKKLPWKMRNIFLTRLPEKKLCFIRDTRLTASLICKHLNFFPLAPISTSRIPVKAPQYFILEQEQTLLKRSAAGFNKVLVVWQSFGCSPNYKGLKRFES